jgi:hypothetical protein
MERRTFLKGAGIAGGLLTALPLSRSFGAPAGNEFPLVDLHVHLTGNFTIDHVMEIQEDECPVRHHGESWRRRK